LTKISWT